MSDFETEALRHKKKDYESRERGRAARQRSEGNCDIWFDRINKMIPTLRYFAIRKGNY